MHTEAVSAHTRPVLDALAATDVTRGFHLAGGTALALHYGHRESIDLDFFAPEPFDHDALKESLPLIGSMEITNEDVDTLDTDVSGVKVSFFRHPHPLLYPVLAYGNVSVADSRDIAPMKLNAISGRGLKKDFIDLWILLRHYSLDELFDFLARRYADKSYNRTHILKSLTYFEDAESDPMPKMLVPASWEDIKDEIIEKVTSYARKLEEGE